MSRRYRRNARGHELAEVFEHSVAFQTRTTFDRPDDRDHGPKKPSRAMEAAGDTELVLEAITPKGWRLIETYTDVGEVLLANQATMLSCLMHSGMPGRLSHVFKACAEVRMRHLGVTDDAEEDMRLLAVSIVDEHAILSHKPSNLLRDIETHFVIHGPDTGAIPLAHVACYVFASACNLIDLQEGAGRQVQHYPRLNPDALRLAKSLSPLWVKGLEKAM